VTGTLPPIDDADLHSFVDNELDPARKQSILSRLAASPADAARAEAWRRQNDALRAAFADILTEPAPPSLSPRFGNDRAESPSQTSGAVGSPASKSIFRRESVTMAGIGLAFAAGVAAAFAASLLSERFDVRTYFRFDREMRGLIARRADEPFVDRTLRAVAPIESLPAGPRPDFGQSADLLIVPNLSDAGLRLAGIRPGSSSPGLPLCLLYLTTGEVEVTLCVDTMQSQNAMTRRDERDLAQPTISWRQKGARYSLTSTLADKDLAALAERARTEIDKFALR
jgi:anti-sigma factor RsiW